MRHAKIGLYRDLLAFIDRMAGLQICDRSQVLRNIIAFGAPFLIDIKSVNLSRVLLMFEILVEDCIKPTLISGQNDLTMLLKSVQRNLKQYHV